MKIALFTESYFPVVNGVTTSVQVLYEQLLALGHDPVIVAPAYPGFADGAIRILRLPSWRTPLNPQNPFSYPPWPDLSPPLLNLEVDLVHVHHPFGIGQQAAALAHRNRVPLVTTFHTLYMEYAHYVPFLPKPLVAGIINTYLRRFYRQCERIIVPSHEAGRRLIEIGVPPEKLAMVPTGVPDAPSVTSGAIAATRKRFCLPESETILLFVGRLAQEKNLDLLLDSYALLWAHGERSVLVLAGDGPYRPFCERQVQERGLADSVRFTGFLNKEELAPLYALATLFVFPSSSETQGVVLCEALSFGVPCVVVTGGGASEFVRDGVDSIVTSSAPEPFTDGIESLLHSEPLRQQFAAVARSTPLRLTPSQMTQRIIDLYCAAISSLSES